MFFTCLNLFHKLLRMHQWQLYIWCVCICDWRPVCVVFCMKFKGLKVPSPITWRSYNVCFSLAAEMVIAAFSHDAQRWEVRKQKHYWGHIHKISEINFLEHFWQITWPSGIVTKATFFWNKVTKKLPLWHQDGIMWLSGGSWQYEIIFKTDTPGVSGKVDQQPADGKEGLLRAMPAFFLHNASRRREG